MNAKTVLSWMMLFSSGLWGPGAACQSLAPVDLSAFGTNPQIRARLTRISSSECRALSMRDGTLHHYDVNLSGIVVFENHSQRTILLYKDFSVLTARLALSAGDLTSGRFVAGFDGDRMAISSKPEQVSISDFQAVAPGKSYASTVSTTVPLAAGSKTRRPQTSGTFWVQLGIDARPDEFYYEPITRKDFAREWRRRGQLVEFILTRPFSVDITLDPSAPLCKE